MTAAQRDQARRDAAKILDDAKIVITDEERSTMEIADFGLNDFAQQGLAIIIYANTEIYCGKELIMLPHQTCPQHRHPPIPQPGGKPLPGKMETFRCRKGTVYLYMEGTAHKTPSSKPPAGSEAHYTVWNEIALKPGGQYTIPPNILHWFQAGPEGAVVTEFSSTSRDELDFFTDPNIQRVPVE